MRKKDNMTYSEEQTFYHTGVFSHYDGVHKTYNTSLVQYVTDKSCKLVIAIISVTQFTTYYWISLANHFPLWK